MSAVMAVLSAMGLLADGQALVMESLIGTTLTGRITNRTSIGQADAVIPEIQGSSWITGEHVFHVADDDPLGEGFTI
jgi:proline racemase